MSDPRTVDSGTMHVGIARLWLRMPENASLKDKRQVLRSLIQRIRNEFHVAVAEVGAQDEWQVACLGVSTVSGDARLARQVMDKVVGFVRETRLDADLYDYEAEVEQF